MAMMKGVSFLLMTITSLILSCSLSSAKEFESPPLNPQVEQGKHVGKELIYCGSVLYLRVWSCWRGFLANENIEPCCTALVDSMDCPFEIIPTDERQPVKDYCGGVIRNPGSNGPVSSPVRFVDLVKNMDMQVHENGEKH